MVLKNKILLSTLFISIIAIGILLFLSKRKDTSMGWHCDAIFYHIWIKSFADSEDPDQIGDLKGIIEKLDYLNDGNPKTDTDLGITAIWLSPVFECGLKSRDPNMNMHGYDTTDYYTVNSFFGSNRDLKMLLEEAHKRGIKVVFDFVANHTSTSHPWFLNSKEYGNKRDWYVWNDNPGTEWGSAWGGGGTWQDVWKSANGSYYYTAFQTDTLADLNYKNVEVRDKMRQVVRYWLERGFDGVRVDAVKNLFEDGPGLQQHRPATHEYCKELRDMLDSFDDQKVMIAEAYSSGAKTAQYYGNGTDEFHMCFDFQLPQMIAKAVNGYDVSNVIDHYTYQQKELPEGARPASFLSNHDNVISRPFTQYFGDTKKCVLAAAYNLLAPTTPFIYYGNEIGMRGESGDDIKLRKLFNWQAVETQTCDPDSLLSWYRYLIKARNRYVALRRGKLIPIPTSDYEVAAFLRSYHNEQLLVILNNSKTLQTVNLDFTGIDVQEKPVSAVLGVLHGETTLEGHLDDFEVKQVAAQSLMVLYIGDERQENIHGYSQNITGGAEEVQIVGTQYPSMFIRGTMNDWKGDLPMKRVGDHVWKKEISVSKGEHSFKFEVSGESTWKANWGDSNLDNIGDLEGGNIPLHAKRPGTYMISFNEETKEFHIRRK